MALYGIINQRYAGDFSGPSGTSVQQFTQEFRQAVNDPNVKAIVIDVDSPGGSVSGVDELATEIFNARSKKKITAVSNCLCASAAYYLAAQASEVVVSPSSMTGSIGVFMAHQDESKKFEQMGIKVTLISAGKYKVDGNNLGPLSDTARASTQGLVDTFYGKFAKAVARGRGVKVSAVTDGFGEGRVLTAEDAVKAGLADRVATLDDVLASYGVGSSRGASAMSRGSMAAHGAQGAVPRSDDDSSMDVGDGDEACTCPCEPCQGGDCEGCMGCDACGSEMCQAGDCEACMGSPEAKASKKAEIEAAHRARKLRLAAL
jgi:signal peptide peptidase SppA